MNVSTWEVGPPGPVPVRKRRYWDIALALVEKWMAMRDAGDASPWTFKTVMRRPIDPRLSGLRNLIRDRCDAGDVPLLTLHKRWDTPKDRGERMRLWRNRDQGVELWLDENQDPRTAHIQKYNRMQEIVSAQRRKEQRQVPDPTFVPVVPSKGVVSLAAPEAIERERVRKRFRFLPNETVQEFRIRMDISDYMDLEEWASIMKYDLVEPAAPESVVDAGRKPWRPGDGV